ncbi:MAG: M23 family metallopeptidase [candidate division WOR-3 bacterium]
MLFLFLLTQTLTSSFLENRGIRFHTGIDLSTYKKNGIPIFSPFSGKIVRIVDKWEGYGKAIYIQNNENLIYVYAHLDKFDEKIEEKVYFEKKKIKKNEIDLYIELEIEKNERFAFSGNSGTVIPHIHLETRRNFNKPINPLYFFDIKDTIKPVIDKIKIYPIGKSLLFGSFAPYEFKKPFPETLYITSDFFLWISAYDLQSENSDRMAIYGLKVYLSDTLICDLKYDSINFDNSFIARALYTSSNNSFSSSYIHPINLQNNLWTGNTFISLKKELTNLKILVYDFKGNKDSLIFWIKKKNSKHLKRGKNTYFVFDGIVFIDSTEKKIILSPGSYGKLNDLSYVFPLPEKSYNIKLKKYEIKINKETQFFPYPLFFKEKEDTLFIFSAEILFKNPLEIKVKNKKEKEVILVNNGFKNKYDFFSSDSVFIIYSWGKFFKRIDTLKPEIIANKIYYINPSNFEIKFWVKDNFKVKNIEFYLDGEWEPTSFNPLTGKAKVVIKRRINKKESKFEIYAEDRSGNFSKFEGKIIYKI